MEKKHLGALALVLLVVGGFFGYPYLQWFQLDLEAREAIDDKHLGRFPSPDEIVDFAQVIRGLAAKRGFAELDVSTEVIEKEMGPTTFWYLEVRARSGSRSLFVQRRIETPMDHGTIEYLEEEGISVTTAGG